MKSKFLKEEADEEKDENTFLAGLVLLAILYKPVKNRIQIAMAPEKILVLGQRVDEYGVNFNRQIKDQEKVTAFEKFFDQVVFKQGWEGDLEGSDLVTLFIRMDFILIGLIYALKMMGPQ